MLKSLEDKLNPVEYINTQESILKTCLYLKELPLEQFKDSTAYTVSRERLIRHHVSDLEVMPDQDVDRAFITGKLLQELSEKLLEALEVFDKFPR